MDPYTGAYLLESFDRPLHLAQSPEMVDALLQCGALIEGLDSLRLTPLQRAKRNRRDSVVAALIAHGAYVDRSAEIVLEKKKRQRESVAAAVLRHLNRLATMGSPKWSEVYVGFDIDSNGYTSIVSLGDFVEVEVRIEKGFGHGVKIPCDSLDCFEDITDIGKILMDDKDIPRDAQDDVGSAIMQTIRDNMNEYMLHVRRNGDYSCGPYVEFEYSEVSDICVTVDVLFPRGWVKNTLSSPEDDENSSSDNKRQKI
jgi:hypothetical protein